MEPESSQIAPLTEEDPFAELEKITYRYGSEDEKLKVLFAGAHRTSTGRNKTLKLYMAFTFVSYLDPKKIFTAEYEFMPNQTYKLYKVNDPSIGALDEFRPSDFRKEFWSLL